MIKKLTFVSIVTLVLSIQLQANWIDSGLEKIGLKRLTTLDKLYNKSCAFKDTVADLCNDVLQSPDITQRAQALGALAFGLIGTGYTIKALTPFVNEKKTWKDVFYPVFIAAGCFAAAYKFSCK